MSKKVQTHGMELEKIGPYTLFHLAHYTVRLSKTAFILDYLVLILHKTTSSTGLSFDILNYLSTQP